MSGADLLVGATGTSAVSLLSKTGEGTERAGKRQAVVERSVDV